MRSTDFKNSFREGLNSEQQFVQLALQRGFETKTSSRNEDMRKHIDVFIRKNNRTFSVDVKAPKRPSRHSTSNFMETTWIEIENVRGDVGWIYGEQDLIAFDFDDKFILVKRTELMSYIESIIVLEKNITSNIRNADYSLYQRPGRKDIISRISSSDLYMLEHKIWYKH